MSIKERKQQRLEREELTKTKVLNLQELERAAKYEKTISKKPAVLIAILGALLITTGLSYAPIMNIITSEPIIETASVSKKQIPTPPADTNTLMCTYKILNQSDGTDLSTVINLHFTDEKLSSYDKITDITTTPGKEDIASVTLKDLSSKYKLLEQKNIIGYSLTTETITNGIEISVDIDLNKLSLTDLTEEYNSNVITRNDFSLDDTKTMVKEKANALGYTCTLAQDK